jgi:hypothetical protein
MFVFVVFVLVVLELVEVEVEVGKDLHTKSSLHIGQLVRNIMFLKIHDE